MLDEELVHAYLIILPANRVPQGGKWALPISKPAGGGYQIFVLRIDDFGIHQYSLGLTVRPQHESCATDRSPSLSGYLLHQIIYLMPRDRKSTRLNSSYVAISYAVFCLKKKKQ